jgi:hypothetical protein
MEDWSIEIWAGVDKLKTIAELTEVEAAAYLSEGQEIIVKNTSYYIKKISQDFDANTRCIFVTESETAIDAINEALDVLNAVTESIRGGKVDAGLERLKEAIQILEEQVEV